MTLIATVGGSTSNAYNTVAETTALLAERLHAEPWTDASTVDQEAASIMATRGLDLLVSWYGAPATPTQALAWPQIGQVDRLGRVIVSTIIPPDIKVAMAEYALALLREQSEAANMSTTYRGSGIEEIAMDDMRLKFASGVAVGQQLISARTNLPLAVRQLLRPYGDVAGDVTIPLVRT